MKKIIRLFFIIGCVLVCVRPIDAFAARRVKAVLFYLPTCKTCILVKERYLPGVLEKYRDTVIVDIEYKNVLEEENLAAYVAVKNQYQVDAHVPALLIGGYFLADASQIHHSLESLLSNPRCLKSETPLPGRTITLTDLFNSFSPAAIALAGLIDGVNPCAFTVLIFFVSFLSLMGYSRRDIMIIGGTFVFAVFLTYLAIGMGLFRGLYELRNFRIILQWGYVGMACFCFFLAYLNIRDVVRYRKKATPEAFSVKLPKPIRNRINKIIQTFYRTDGTQGVRSRLALGLSAFVVGFLISLLEAVCTGQVYVPAIALILQKPALRMRAFSYLVLYNTVFVLPLIVILAIAGVGVRSQAIEAFFRKHVGITKVCMATLFLLLGGFLLVGLYR